MSLATVTTTNPNSTTQHQPTITSNKKSDFWQSRLTQNGVLGMSSGEIARKVGAVFLQVLGFALLLGIAYVSGPLYVGTAALVYSKAVCIGLIAAFPLTLLGIFASFVGSAALWNEKDKNTEL